MPPLHRFDNPRVVVVDDDDERDDAFFLPLDQRRWSDASEVSAYCIHPDDGALRRHAHRTLQPKKVAVIGAANSRSIVCAATLKQDGHQVTVFEASPQIADAGIEEHRCHPDFSLRDHQQSNLRSLDYVTACASHFGVTVRCNTRVSEMVEKFGGWVLMYHDTRNNNHQSNEYFDFVVLAAEASGDEEEASSFRPVSRFYWQFLLPLLLGFSWMVETLRLLRSKFLRMQPTYKQKNGSGVSTQDHLPGKYENVLRCDSRLYRQIISPGVPRAAFFGKQLEDTSSSYLASIWLSTFLYDEMNVSVDGMTLHSSISNQQKHSSLRYNDLLLQDLGMNHHRKETPWEEYFGTYTSVDYAGVLHQVQQRRRISRREGWAVPLTPVPRGL